MELRRLDSGFVSDLELEGWDSVIWTERYAQAGEFEIKTADILGMMAKLPLDSFITHAETQVVMIVESYEIEEDAEGIDYLTIKGRSFETIFERRIAADKNGNPWALTDTAANIAVFLMSLGGAFASANVMMNTNTTFYGDRFPSVWAAVVAGANTGAVSTLQTIPIDYTYPSVMKLLNQDGLGIRINRSDRSGGGLKIEIYKGNDKRVNFGPLYNTVSIDVDRGDVSKGTYVISKKALRNVSYPMRTSATSNKNYIETGFITDRNRAGFDNDGNLPQGFSRRDLLLDATDVDATVVGSGLGSLLLARNAAALKATEGFTVASVTATGTIPYKYKTDYDLGDLVSFRGSYGIRADLMVTEYIRVHDASGDSGYPSLSGGS